MSVGVRGTICQVVAMHSGLDVRVLTGFPAEPKQLGTVISPIFTEGDTETQRAGEVTQGHRAGKWRNQEDSTDPLTSAMCFPRERPPDAQKGPLAEARPSFQGAHPEVCSAHSAPPDLQALECGALP